MDQLLLCKKTDAKDCGLQADKGTVNALSLNTAITIAPVVCHLYLTRPLPSLFLLLFSLPSDTTFAEPGDAANLPQQLNCLTTDNHGAAYQLLHENSAPMNSNVTVYYFDHIGISLNTDNSTREETSYEQGKLPQG
jgi:hypothetical protein